MSNKKNQISESADPREQLKNLLKNIKQDKVMANRTISTGSVFLDHQINPKFPGLRTGKTHVFAGRPGSGKSSLCLSMARALLAKNKPDDETPRQVVYFDVENGMDDALLHLYGLTKYTTPNFEYKVINNGPKILSTLERIIDAYQGVETEVLVIVDSIPHLSFAQDEDRYQDYAKTAAVALGPNKLKVFFRENKSRLANTNICLVLLTFMTANINRQSPYDAQYVLSGGSYLEYAADVAIELKAAGAPRETEFKPPSGSEAPKSKGIGKFQDVKLRFIKNKCSPKKELEYTLCLVKDPAHNLNPGIQDLTLLIDYAAEHGVIERKGSWYNYEGCSFQGIKATQAAFREAIAAAREGREPSDPKYKDMHVKLYEAVRKAILKEHNMSDD